MTVSPLTRSQWVSVAKNALFAGLSAFAVAIQVQGLTRPGLEAAAVAGVTAALKVVEKLFSTE